MKKGDKFICYLGETAIIGEVERVFVKIKYDVDHGVKIQVPYIVSTQGREFSEKSCFIIDSEIRSSFIKRVIRYCTR